MTPEQMWENFVKYLAEHDAIGKPNDKGVYPPHVNMVGSIEKYKKLFLKANKE